MLSLFFQFCNSLIAISLIIYKNYKNKKIKKQEKETRKRTSQKGNEMLKNTIELHHQDKRSKHGL